MAYDEKILKYEMTDKDNALANMARVIVGAFSGSYKPHLILKGKEVAPPYYKWKHSPEGYSLISSDTEGLENVSVLVTDENINEFVEHVFLVLAGNPSVKWDIVMTSSAVSKAVVEWFGKWINEDLNDPEYKFEQLDNPNDYFNKPPLCGIYKNGNDEWVFIHQAYPAPGDHPNHWLTEITNSSLIALIESEIIFLCRHVKIKREGKRRN